MQNSSKEVSKKYFLLLIAIATFIICTNFSLEPEDSKYLIALILFFPLWFVFFRTSISLDREKTKRRDLTVVFGCYSLYILANWYFLGKGYYALRGMNYQWICLLSFITGALFLQRGKQILIIASIIAASIGAFFAIGEYFAFFSYNVNNAWPPVVTGLFAHKNPFILFIIWSLTWSVYFSVVYKNTIVRILLLLSIVLQFYALIISDSRGGLILAVVAAFLVTIPLMKKSTFFNKRRNRIIAYTTLFLIAFIPIISWNEHVWNRLASLTLATSDGPVYYRIELYKAECNLIKDKPVFGCGIGNFVYDNVHYWSEKFRKKVQFSGFPRNAESEFLEVLTEQGIVGFAFFIFFVAGAIVFTIRALKNEWNWEMYILFVLFIIMLLNGLFDTGLRRVPLAMLFWLIMGYFWKDHVFLKSCITSKGFRYASVFSICIHILVVSLFVKMLAADYYFLRSTAIKNKNPVESGKKLIKALKLYPDHPDALYQLAFISAKNGDLNNVNLLIKRLEKSSADYRPLNFVSSYAAYNRSQFDTALHFVNKELGKNPKFRDADELRLMTLSKLNKCRELNLAQDSLAINTIGCQGFKQYRDTVSVDGLQNEYVVHTGKLRTVIGGNSLKNAYKKYREYHTWLSLKQCEQISRMTTIKCTDNSTLSIHDSTQQ